MLNELAEMLSIEDCINVFNVNVELNDEETTIEEILEVSEIEQYPDFNVLEAFYMKDTKLIIGNNYLFGEEPSDEEDEVVPDKNLITIISNRKNTIDDYVKYVFESGEILFRIGYVKTNDRLNHEVIYESINFVDDPIPINYN